MPNYESIKPIVYKIEFIAEIYERDDNSTIFNYVDNIVIQFDSSFIHFGKICYVSFKNKKQCDNRYLHVIKKSLNKTMVIVARELIHYVCDLYIGGMRIQTIFSRAKKIMSFFIYLKENDINLMINESSIRHALIEYSNFLNHKIKIYDRGLGLGIGTSTAHNTQTWILSFCTFLLKNESVYLIDHSHLIVTNVNEVIKTKPLSLDILTSEFNAYIHIFREFSKIILDDEMFPLSFDLNGEIYWITPSGKIIHKNDSKLNESGYFNYDAKEYYSVDELIKLKRFKNLNRTRISNVYIKNSKDSKVKANREGSYSRLFLISCACKAYFMSFLFLTGENDSTAATLSYENEYLLCNAEQNFKSIKWRANGIDVNYDIQNEFIDDFKLYLNLREYVLKYLNQECKDLFLDLSSGKLIKVRSNGGHSSFIRKAFSSLFSKNSFTGKSREIRITKGLWIRDHYGSGVSHYLLQHSKKTSDSNYTGSSFEKSSEELVGFFSELTEQLLMVPGVELSTPSGNCIEPGMPEALSKLAQSNLLTIDCREQKSCLFCSKYRLHSDEDDIRKLLSIKYLITISAHLSSSIEHFNKVYKPILDRIEELLERIRDQGDEFRQLILDVNKQVFEQEQLSEYWYRKLEFLDELGVL